MLLQVEGSIGTFIPTLGRATDGAPGPYRHSVQNTGVPRLATLARNDTFVYADLDLEERTTATTGGAAGDGRDYGEFVGVGDDSGFFFRKVAEVFVIEIDVDERTELALVVEELRLEVGELGGERGEDLGDCGTRDADRLGSVGVNAERCGDVDVHALPFRGIFVNLFMDLGDVDLDALVLESFVLLGGSGEEEGVGDGGLALLD